MSQYLGKFIFIYKVKFYKNAPQAVMRNDFVDYAIVGEAEESLPALLDELAGGGEGAGVPGLWRRAGGKILSEPPAAPVADLAALPNPAARGRYLYQHLFPSPHFMLKQAAKTSALWLPWLYLLRAGRGIRHLAQR